jgi:FKBP-type peptidyl-prolyl cis-trans isomerase FkpA
MKTKINMKDMKKTCCLLLSLWAFSACKNSGSGEGASSDGAQDKDTSYAFGVDYGSQLKSVGLSLDYDAFVQGAKDVVAGKETRVSAEQAQAMIETAYRAAMGAKTEDLRQKENTFLAGNKTKDGILVTESGLQYERLTIGTGFQPVVTDVVRVNYEGSLVDGTVFDSSYERGEPVEFPLNAVIRGWTEGLQLMTVGSTYRFYVPSELGYGPEGRPSIPPYATLIFKVELLDIVEQAEQ